MALYRLAAGVAVLGVRPPLGDHPTGANRPRAAESTSVVRAQVAAAIGSPFHQGHQLRDGAAAWVLAEDPVRHGDQGLWAPAGRCRNLAEEEVSDMSKTRIVRIFWSSLVALFVAMMLMMVGGVL